MSTYLLGAKNPEIGRQVAAQRAHDPTFEVGGLLDNNHELWGRTVSGLVVLGGFEIIDRLLATDPRADFVNLASGTTQRRHEATEEMLALGCRMRNLIHPSVDLTDVVVGTGCYIQDGCLIQAGAVIGDNVAFQAGVMICHESTLGVSCFAGPGAVVAGEVSMGDGVFVGVNATILPRIAIGAWATIGAGSVVLADVDAGITVAGNPARTLTTGPSGGSD